MSYRPLIAVVGYHLDPARVTRWPQGGYGVPAPYLDALRRTGVRVAIVSPGEQGAAEELLAPFDGLLLVGGGDVDPVRYGADPDVEHDYGIEPDRDELEIELLRVADRDAVPTLCICRGVQVMNVAFGGTLHQHLPDVTGLLEHGLPIADTASKHEVNVSTTSRMFATTKSTTLSCSSHHHQGIAKVGDGLTATGWSPDGLVEAIERRVDDPYADVWMVGVQWHPEDTAAADPSQQSLFDALANLSRWRGSRAKQGESSGRSRAYGLVDYELDWPRRFEEIEGEIRTGLGHLAVRIDHVGSTAVPGLAAKDVIDVQVAVESLEPRSAYREPLEQLGYRFLIDPIEVEHDFFNRGYDDGSPYAVHVHVCPAGSEWERRHLAFRDVLRRDPDTAAAYEALKRRLAAEHPRDIQAYVDGKTEFIREVEQRAGVGGGVV